MAVRPWPSQIVEHRVCAHAREAPSTSRLHSTAYAASRFSSSANISLDLFGVGAADGYLSGVGAADGYLSGVGTADGYLSDVAAGM